MKRLCIYVTYDYENVVDDYIGYMLQELRKSVDCLVVVCNYEYIAKGIDNIHPYADRIFYRKNTGFDAGAYKDVLCQYLGWDVMCRYDELLLVNDSFYGPFYSFGDLFYKMEHTDTDYWGMTRSPEAERDGHMYGSHIQSYFLALRQSILKSEEFRTFWEDMVYPSSLMQAIILFEIGMNTLLQQLGFTGVAAMDQCSYQWNLRKNENPHILYPLELIRDARVPVLKRKCLSLANKRFADAIGALKYIENECGYDTSLIMKHLLRIGKGTDLMGLDKFYVEHPRIFIYGAGLYGRNLAEYFAYKGWVFEKFLVTDAYGLSGECLSFDHADIAESDGIIIAVGNRDMFSEILSVVEKRCSAKQIFNTECSFW